MKTPPRPWSWKLAADCKVNETTMLPAGTVVTRASAKEAEQVLYALITSCIIPRPVTFRVVQTPAGILPFDEDWLIPVTRSARR